MSTKKKPMTIGLAVFNGHVNDADRRARELMMQTYPMFLEEITAIEVAGNGIMAIFDVKPATHAINIYSTLVFAYVNENRGDTLDDEPVEERPIRKRQRAIQL